MRTPKPRSTAALRRAFDGLSVEVETLGCPSDAWETEHRVRVGSRIYKLRARWVGEGWPSEVKSAAPELAGAWPRQLVATARRFSPGALNLLADADANWADESGQSRIVQRPGLAILREPARKPAQARSRGEFRWSPSAAEIAEFSLTKRIQLGRKDLQLRTGEISTETRWSPAQVSQVLQAFDSAGWTISRGGRSGRSSWRELAEPGVLLDAWADHVGRGPRRALHAHVVARDLVGFARARLGPALEAHGIEWALTGWAGLELLAPFATTTPMLQVYVTPEGFDAGLHAVLREMDVREVSEGARLEFREATFTLRRNVAKTQTEPAVWVASIPRVYADLTAMGGRAADAATHLREVRIGF